MKAIELANRWKVHETLVSHIRHHRKFTDDISRAMDMAELTGKKPIIFIHPKLRKIMLLAYPSLKEKIRIKR